MRRRLQLIAEIVGATATLITGGLQLYCALHEVKARKEEKNRRKIGFH